MTNKINTYIFAISIFLFGIPGQHAMMLRGRNDNFQTRVLHKVLSNPSVDFLRSAIPSHLQLMNGNKRVLQQHNKNDNIAHSNITADDEDNFWNLTNLLEEDTYFPLNYSYDYNGASVNCTVGVGNAQNNDGNDVLDQSITTNCHICFEEDMCVDQTCTVALSNITKIACTTSTSPESSGFPAAMSVSTSCDLSILLSADAESEDVCSCDSASLDGEECSSCSFNPDCLIATSTNIDPFAGFNLSCPNMDFAPTCV